MITRTVLKSAPLLLLCLSIPCSAVDHFVSPTGGNVAPFTSWDTAATNIQDAIDAASAGETVWVTNGVYASGGKVMAGDLTNRVVLDKALTVQSVNGPFLTTIQGAWDPVTTNGPLALRCAWITNGAVLKGFTLLGGATRNTGTLTLENGGGAWCSDAGATVANCFILSNAAYASGCGVYNGTVINSGIRGNVGSTSAGATASAKLLNCTVVSNSCAGALSVYATNSILYYNASRDSLGTLVYCCSTVVPVGLGNIASPPQLLSDGVHLSSSSPCIAAGTNISTGADIDDQPWAAPPSMGCDEWYGPPTLKTQPTLAFLVDPPGFSIRASLTRLDPFACWWTKDGALLSDTGHFAGTQTTNLAALGVSFSDAGNYQLVLSNSYGIATSAVAQLVIHCADAAGTNPIPPFLDWSTAATNIQDAIDASSPGDIVLVTDGLYAVGGKVMSGDLTNRVTLDKAIMVQSINGSTSTIIQGMTGSAINGPTAVRCAWLTNGAVLSGFTLQFGATRTSGDTVALQSGGAVWANTNSAVVAGCTLRASTATLQGGGAYAANLVRCTITGNNAPGVGAGGGTYNCNMTNCLVSGNFAASSGGGTYLGVLVNSLISGNLANFNGGGAYISTLLNCTVVGNIGCATTPGQGGGIYSCRATNSIVYANRTISSQNASTSNYYSGIIASSCTAPLPPGAGNIAADPQFLRDGVHLTSTSPCVAAGLHVTRDSDIDGQAWANPPSMGCDQWLPIPFVINPIQVVLTSTPPAAILSCIVAGQEPFAFSWLKGGNLLQNGPKYSGAGTANLVVNAFSPDDAGAYQVIASNGFGSSTGSLIQIVLHCVDATATSSVPPFVNWFTAATNIQDAIDAASPGDIVLVTNGIYSGGGRVMAGDLNNRIAVDKPLLISSVNGPASTVVLGAYDAVTTNGPLAERCAWLTGGAILRGLTLQSGATRNSGDVINLQSGGGAWCNSTNELLLNCILTNCAAASYGGGSFRGQLVRSVVWGNSALQGGGAYSAFCLSSLIRSNSASQSGGGLYSSAFADCTIRDNAAPLYAGGGINYCLGTNSIVYYNIAFGAPNQGFQNDRDYLGSASTLVSCWTTSGINDYSTPAPQLVVDGVHLAATSPCRAAGNPLYATGTDFDGEPWLYPPSIGCDEYYAADFTGSLLPGPITAGNIWTRGAVVRNVSAFVSTALTGSADRVAWAFGDGTLITNNFTLGLIHKWTSAGDFNVTFTAYNADNPGGVSTNALIHVNLPDAPLISAAPANGTNLVLTFPTQPGLTYVVEQATNLAPPTAWQSVVSLFSYGGAAFVTNNTTTNATAFFRVRVP